jgi:hypothetical protein
MTGGLFMEVEHCRRQKHGEDICGDAFVSRKLADEDRVVAVLSDGLGSGVKANILASMTATMALRFAVEGAEILQSADIMMSALPVCKERHISYATFTIVDTSIEGTTRVIEQGNPEFLLIRNGQALDVPCTEKSNPKWRDRRIRFYQVDTRAEDRLVVFSDGVSQAGMGTERLPLGWRVDGCRTFVQNVVHDEPRVSSRRLARMVVDEALRSEPGRLPGDDMTCAVLYFREPRRLLVLSGPPFDETRDHEMARMVDEFEGRTAVCGGTTADIVARELNRKITTELGTHDVGLPPTSRMHGLDLVTEGILTLTRAARLLEGDQAPDAGNGAARLVHLLRESDQIRFQVGTRINEAHQDPALPVDLDIRRNIVKKIARLLEEKYLKEVEIDYV